MSLSLDEFLASAPGENLAAPGPARITGYVDVQRSTPAIVYFSADPCGPWLTLPGQFIESVEPQGQGECEGRTIPRVVLRFKQGDPVSESFSSLLAGAGLASSPPVLATLPSGTPHDLQLLFTRFGSIDDWQIHVEGRPVKNPAATSKGFLYKLPSYPVEGKLEVILNVQGVNGAVGTLVVTADGKELSPPLKAQVVQGGGSDNKTYSI